MTADEIMRLADELIDATSDRMLMKTFNAKRNALAAAVRELEREREDWARRFKLNGVTPWEWMTRAEKAKQEAKRLRELLRPLACLSQPHNDRIADSIPLFSINGKAITAGDARAAKAALGETDDR